MSLLVIFEIWGLFVNTLNVYDTYSVCNSENLWQPIQMQLFKKKTVSEVFAPDLKKDDSYSLCMSKITDCEIYDKWIKSLVSEHVWAVNMLKDLKHWWSLQDDTTTTLTIFIFGLFINRLTTKHSFRNSENLPPRIQMQISRKQKNIFWIFCSISEIYISFWTFWNKRWPS